RHPPVQRFAVEQQNPTGGFLGRREFVVGRGRGAREQGGEKESGAHDDFPGGDGRYFGPGPNGPFGGGGGGHPFGGGGGYGSPGRQPPSGGGNLGSGGGPGSPSFFMKAGAGPLGRGVGDSGRVRITATTTPRPMRAIAAATTPAIFHSHPHNDAF